MSETRFTPSAQIQSALRQLRSKYAGTDYEVRLASDMPHTDEMRRLIAEAFFLKKISMPPSFTDEEAAMIKLTKSDLEVSACGLTWIDAPFDQTPENMALWRELALRFYPLRPTRWTRIKRWLKEAITGHAA